mmetsp:Transcript_18235/g.43346  ORF Transcript_18235/g.43346 Transcript_18235/m.43346 type:complete len:211 (+) Transcript_18235:180-812(+)|eukprot:scaffold102188_cov58-Phaeocystis_antarctica.AAC.2
MPLKSVAGSAPWKPRRTHSVVTQPACSGTPGKPQCHRRRSSCSCASVALRYGVHLRACSAASRAAVATRAWLYRCRCWPRTSLSSAASGERQRSEHSVPSSTRRHPSTSVGVGVGIGGNGDGGSASLRMTRSSSMKKTRGRHASASSDGSPLPSTEGVPASPLGRAAASPGTRAIWLRALMRSLHAAMPRVPARQPGIHSEGTESSNSSG